MRNRVLLIVLLITSNSFSQQFLLPYRSGELWGYADAFGNVVVEPKYDSVSITNENQRWEVYKNGRVGVINSKGVELLKPIYSDLKRDPKHSEYHDYYVELDSKVGYSYMNGDFIIEPKYKELIACEFDYRYDHTKAYTFIASESIEKNTYQVIDKNEVVLVASITDIAHITDHFYQFKVGNMWGIYNAIGHKWSIENRFDTIVRFENYYDRSYKRVEKPYEFYAKEKNKIFLINGEFEIIENSKQKLDSLLPPPELDEDEELREIPMVEMVTSFDATFKDLSTFSENEYGELELKQRNSQGIRVIRLVREEDQVGLEIATSGIHRIEAEYDAIYANIDERGRLNHTYFLIKKNEKWGVYGLTEDKIVVPVEYDSIVTGDYGDVMKVYQKERLGLFQMNLSRRDPPSYFFRPEFDQFLYRDSARSNDFEYDSHEVYFFEKDGVVCPISQHGVKLYD